MLYDIFCCDTVLSHFRCSHHLYLYTLVYYGIVVIVQLREAMRKEAEKQQKRHDDEVSRGRDIHEFNKQFKILSAQEARTQAEQDAILLHYAMQKEREKDAEEKAKRDGAREASRTYKKYLEEQMVKEAEDTG